MAQTLNFRPKYKFLQLNFFSGVPVPVGGALGSLGQSLARVKICAPAPPNVVSRKMSTWVGQYVCGPKFTIFSPNVEGVVVDQVFLDVRYVDPFRR